MFCKKKYNKTGDSSDAFPSMLEFALDNVAESEPSSHQEFKLWKKQAENRWRAANNPN